MSRSGARKERKGLVRGVIHPGLSHRPEEVVGMYEADGMPASDGSISEGLSNQALSHADRSDEQDVLVAVEELEGEGVVEESSIECDGCGPVEVFEAAGLLEVGPLETELEPSVVSAVDLIGQYDLQEGYVVELLPASESDSLRQGVEHGAELEALEQRGESVVVVMRVLLVLDERCGRWHERRRCPAWRIDLGGIGGGSGCMDSCSRASTSMRSRRRTSIRSTERALRHAASRRSGE